MLSSTNNVHSSSSNVTSTNSSNVTTTATSQQDLLIIFKTKGRCSQQQQQEIIHTADNKLTDTASISYWNIDTYWITNNSVCDWYGVSCHCNNNTTNKGIIDILNLTQNNLHGTLASELVLLGDNLRALDLGNNYLFGTISPSFLSMKKSRKFL